MRRNKKRMMNKAAKQTEDEPPTQEQGNVSPIPQPVNEPPIPQPVNEPPIQEPDNDPPLYETVCESPIEEQDNEPPIPEPGDEPPPDHPYDVPSANVYEEDPTIYEQFHQYLDTKPSMPESRGTIVPMVDFKAEWAAERLKKSMRGIGTDEKMIIKLLVSHDSLQRAEIEQKYKAMYGQDLIEDLRAELGGHFEDAVVALLNSKYELLVYALGESFRLGGSDANVLIEILCSRDSSSIESLKTWYQKIYSQSLEDAMHFSLKGDFRKLMISLVQGERPQDDEVDEQYVKEDVEKLYDAGVSGLGTDESQFINVLNNRSFTHLNRVFQEYEKFSNQPIEESINSEFSGDIREGLKAIVKRVKDPHGFFAERLNESLRGAGTDDKTLIRIIVSRSEDDLEDIKERYLDMYGTSLANDVKEDCGGDYAKLLLAIINNNVVQS